MTWPAVMVVPLTVPSTTTLSPFLTALAEVGLVPFRYMVDDTSSMVTFWPAEVASVKLDLGALATVPAAPPAAGPDRALEPSRPGIPDVVGRGRAAVAPAEPLVAVALTTP